MIPRYLIDSSALWRLQRDKTLLSAWSEVIGNGAVGSCAPQRSEFRASARNRHEYDDMTEMFAVLYSDVAVPKSGWQWIESAQYKLAASGEHRGLSVVDLLVSATAAHHGLTVLHDDNDFSTVARTTRDLRERSIHNLPG
ncbi:PIN domain-containing protein [Streptomyces sp. NBC_00237]|uniref:PIN domain-containing protein n=1 Tax=Streptomyces sp. NBC_00237 TaxID=2975687 RepID=UPI00224F6AF8|nr:PIN domain-containing protein [Streptomyces sp. NBC_00237]MCX5204984.1 PIN domain-containing protein [Streptomyces sp. NBC_00237]